MNLQQVLGEGRDFEVVELLARDSLTVSEIAAKLNVSASTVSTHLRRARDKVGARNAFEMVKLYWQWRSAGDREFQSWALNSGSGSESGVPA